MLSSGGGLSTFSQRSFVEIRSQHEGLSVAFEGYTPKGNKLYSIRAHLPKEADLSGTFPANVFNGSSAHEFLGKAVLELKASE